MRRSLVGRTIVILAATLCASTGQAERPQLPRFFVEKDGAIGIGAPRRSFTRQHGTNRGGQEGTWVRPRQGKNTLWAGTASTSRYPSGSVSDAFIKQWDHKVDSLATRQASIAGGAGDLRVRLFRILEVLPGGARRVEDRTYHFTRAADAVKAANAYLLSSALPANGRQYDR